MVVTEDQVQPHLMVAALILQMEAQSIARNGECTLQTYLPSSERVPETLRYHTSAHSPGAALGPTTVPGGISKSVGESFFNDVEGLALVVRRQTAQISMANMGLAKVGLFLRGTTLRGSIFLGSGPTPSGLLQVLPTSVPLPTSLPSPP